MIKYNLVTVGDEANLTAFIDGEMYTASDQHPNFKAIVEAILSDDAGRAIDMFDVSRSIVSRFERLTARVTVSNGVMYLDGDAIHTSLAEQVVRFLDEGVDDWQPLVAFFENVQQNPNENSRNQLFEWLANDESLTITDDGWIVGYKGCNLDKDGVPRSTRQAPSNEKVTVDDVQVTGYVPNPDGATVSMPRSMVDPDEAEYCSVGLHVGTFRYAKSFAPVVLEVHVNPRDVVSVTSDSNREKIRTCSYEVVGVVSQKHTTAVVPASAKRDTRDNHKAQDRYPAGTIIDGVNVAGRFIPKTVSV